LPFNAFHQHQIDEHNIAIASHQKNHQCEIDNSFCKTAINQSCGHEHHLNIPFEKCFSCQFHFEKNYDAVSIFSCTIVSSLFKVTLTNTMHAATCFARLASNKGPPSGIFIG
jgi:hypothetical protein